MKLAVLKNGLASAARAVTALNAFGDKNIPDSSSSNSIIGEAADMRNVLALRLVEIRERNNGTY